MYSLRIVLGVEESGQDVYDLTLYGDTEKLVTKQAVDFFVWKFSEAQTEELHKQEEAQKKERAARLKEKGEAILAKHAAKKYSNQVVLPDGRVISLDKTGKIDKTPIADAAKAGTVTTEGMRWSEPPADNVPVDDDAGKGSE